MKPRHSKIIYFFFILLILGKTTTAQTAPTLKQLPAKRTTAAIKIDGNIDETAWKEAVPATNFIEWRPTADKPESFTNRTIVYMLYDNTSVYIAGYCYENSADSISKELVGRDVVGVNDFVGVIMDTYNDKINAFGFYITPLGEQFDAKYSNTVGEDGSWNAVWDGASKVHSDGWSFEMRIPYSALRFSNQDTQTWGLNITRRRNKTGQQYMWNPINPKINGFVNQEGLWTGIEKINPPVRLSLSPYFSAYANHYPANTPGAKNTSSSVNGGMDLKYGITDGFTLDMTLVPDFGQVQSDNQVLNLSPFEVKYNENRPFFTEGTELFSKGNLFYSRRIGSEPIHYWDVQDGNSSYDHIKQNERFIANPHESKLVNATKISGRTKKGLGVGFFNAITKPMYAEVEDDTKNIRKIQTNPLTNYNILVFDQTLKNNSSVSFINTNVLRNGIDYDANVSAALFDINNKKNTYNWNGKFAVSQLSNPTGKDHIGYSHNLGFGKTGGSLMFQVSQEVADEKYEINDMGILYNNNYVDHYFWTGYRWTKPGKWYNSAQVNYNGTYSRRFNPTSYRLFYTNVNGSVQFKNLWWLFSFVGYNAKGNDFYEPRVPGRIYQTPTKTIFNLGGQTNRAKKFYTELSFQYNKFGLFNGSSTEVNLFNTYRFSDKFSLKHSLYVNPSNNDAGFYQTYTDPNTNELAILFSKRDRKTVENVLTAKYNFNNKSGINIRARHYWSQVKPKELYNLDVDGKLSPTQYNLEVKNQNFNFFNVDAVYTLQFAPGSFINIVWKNAIFNQNNEVGAYFRNFNHTMDAPQNNNLSIKILYYLDYLDFKKWSKKKDK